MSVRTFSASRTFTSSAIASLRLTRQLVKALCKYTALTGRSPVPPLWSFGFWMGRITYNSEEQVRQVAQQLRSHQVPADVIHLDTGWFETEWRGDYHFSTSRFRDPAKMIADLKQQGFRVRLWQYTYFTSKNDLWKEMVARGYHVKKATQKPGRIVLKATSDNLSSASIVINTR